MNLLQTNLITLFVLIWSVVRMSLFHCHKIVKNPTLQCIGKVGKIKKIDADGDVHIMYGLKTWVFHPDAVTKVRIYLEVYSLNFKENSLSPRNYTQPPTPPHFFSLPTVY